MKMAWPSVFLLNRITSKWHVFSCWEQMNIVAKIYHPEPLVAVYQVQIPGLVCEENERAKPCQKPWILSATARVSLDLSKAPAVLSETTVRRFAAEWEGLKQYLKLEKSGQLACSFD